MILVSYYYQILYIYIYICIYNKCTLSPYYMLYDRFMPSPLKAIQYLKHCKMTASCSSDSTMCVFNKIKNTTSHSSISTRESNDASSSSSSSSSSLSSFGSSNVLCCFSTDKILCTLIPGIMNIARLVVLISHIYFIHTQYTLC